MPHLATWYIMLHWLHKCRSMLPIHIWILAFCLCYPSFSCSVLRWTLSSHLYWPLWLLCSVAHPASYNINCQVTAWKFSFSFSPYSVFSWLKFSTQDTHLETCTSTQRVVLHLKSLLHLLSVIWHCSAAVQQDFVIHKVGSKHSMITIWKHCSLPNILICCDHVWNQSYQSQEYHS